MAANTLMLVNPRKRKRKSKKRKVTKRRTKRAVSRVSRKRNPARRTGGAMATMMNTQIMPAAVAGAGAVGLDVIYGFLPIPENMKVGPMRHVIKGAGAIGMGMLAGMFMKKSTAKQMATGALTVVMHSAMKEAVTNFAPNVPLGEYNDELGYVGPGYIPGGDDMGAYVDGLETGLTDMDNTIGAYVDEYNQ